MSERVEAAAKAAQFLVTGNGWKELDPIEAWQWTEIAGAILNVADRATFSEDTTDRTAQAVFPHYWTQADNGNVSPKDVASAQEHCREHIRRVFNAMRRCI